jgi:hypothetical protein
MLRYLLAPILCVSLADGQILHHRRHVPDLAVTNANSVFHVGFVASGAAPVQMVLREYVPINEDDEDIAVVQLPGVLVGGAIQLLGTTSFLVGSSTPTGSLATRAQGYISRVEVLVSNGIATGLQVVASESCGAVDPAALFFDRDKGLLYLVDHAHRCIRKAPYSAAGALPQAASWSVLVGASQWGDAAALASSVPVDAAGDVMTWFSPLRPRHLRLVDASVSPASVQSKANDNDAALPINLDAMPDPRGSWQFSTEADTGTSFSVLAADRSTVLYQGSVDSSGMGTVPAIGSLAGVVGQTLWLEVGLRSIEVDLQTRYGRPCPWTGFAAGRQLAGSKSLLGSPLMPVVEIEDAQVSAQGWLLLGWRDPSGQDPLVWQADKALIELGNRGVALPFSAAGSDVWTFASSMVVAPNDDRLADVAVVTQFVFKIGTDYAVSDVVCHRLCKEGVAPASAQDREAAIQAWRTALSGAQPGLVAADVLTSLLNR